MKVLFCDFLRWTFPKANNPLKKTLEELGVECKFVQPCEIGHSNRALMIPMPEKHGASEHRGFDIDSMIKVGVARESGWYTPNIKIVTKYRKWAMFVIDWAFETFEKEKPDYVVVEGGLTYLARAVSEVARELGIKIICVENSFIKGKCFLEFNTGYVVNRHSFARTSQDWMDTRTLTKTREKEANQIIKSVFSSLNYQTTGKFDWNSQPYQKTVVVPLQVYDDQVTLYDSKYNNEQFLNEIFILASTVFKDWNIILRCHPKEEKWRPRTTGDWIQKQKLPHNITVVRGEGDSVNTQDLMRKADIIMVNTSQAGLEAALMGKPVVVFGDAFYANKGFTFNYDDMTEEIWSSVKEVKTDGIATKTAKLWFSYFYKWLYNKEFQQIDKDRIKKEMNL